MIEYERNGTSLRESQDELSDRKRALEPQNAKTISSEETMHLLSSIRLGVNLGLIGGYSHVESIVSSDSACISRKWLVASG